MRIGSQTSEPQPLVYRFQAEPVSLNPNGFEYVSKTNPGWPNDTPSAEAQRAITFIKIFRVARRGLKPNLDFGVRVLTDPSRESGQNQGKHGELREINATQAIELWENTGRRVATNVVENVKLCRYKLDNLHILRIIQPC